MVTKINTANAAAKPLDPQANTIGKAPPKYVPIVGTNCETIPQNSASGSQYGTFINIRKIAVPVALIAAKIVRENKKLDICS